MNLLLGAWFSHRGQLGLVNAANLPGDIHVE
jgi:hypothetical protein